MQIHRRIASSLTFFFVLITSQAWAYEDQKVVYHMNYDDNSRIEETFTNISNHLGELGDEHVDIKVVVHGGAIKYFMEAIEDQGKQMTLDSLRMRDVQFLICRNTLDGYRITREDLYEVEAEDMVQAGLPTIIDLQQRGYFYVRP